MTKGARAHRRTGPRSGAQGRPSDRRRGRGRGRRRLVRQGAAADTAQLVPARGRAARMGALGHGHPDAGAVSLALILTAVGTTLR
ncbi:DAK2 domain-containing protein [Streptomyces hygroscopicus]|uniref:DAK2 domain-containing protein n=1 Tax=Streptomyces hygroscopicus TaxID=1912 RepID=UPI001FCC028D|nr:DAK2 domain-containing protein [Streptomyces hygroscopicus]BDH14668.1 hypothetical protein HOK021_58470 [Streptomyces hygroscopicus]